MKYLNRASYWEKLSPRARADHYVGNARRKVGDGMVGLCGVEGTVQPRKPEGEIRKLCNGCYRVMGAS